MAVKGVGGAVEPRAGRWWDLESVVGGQHVFSSAVGLQGFCGVDILRQLRFASHHGPLFPLVMLQLRGDEAKFNYIAERRRPPVSISNRFDRITEMKHSRSSTIQLHKSNIQRKTKREPKIKHDVQSHSYHGGIPSRVIFISLTNLSEKSGSLLRLIGIPQ